MKRTFFPVIGVLLLSLCVVNSKDCTVSSGNNPCYHKPDTTDVSKNVRLYSRSKSMGESRTNEWAYRSR